MQQLKKQNRNKFLLFFIFIIASFAISFVNLPAQAAITKQINYQGRLAATSGSVVPNGSYNIRFNLYTAPAGGSSVWTEQFTDASSTRITINNGLFSLKLGSTSSLAGVDFNQQLYLGIEIGGSTSTPAWDGEMSPRKSLSSVPSAFTADLLDGLDSTQFLRADNNTTLTASTSATLLTVNQSGSGNVVDFKNGGVSYFNIASNGNIIFGNNGMLFDEANSRLSIGTTTNNSYALKVVGDTYLNGNATTTGSFSAGATTLSSLDVSGAINITGQTTLANASTSNLSVSNNSYLGTVQSGIWNGSIIDIAHGGTGSSTLNTAVVAENSNFLYYTDARARNSISASSSALSYATSTGIFSIAGGYNIPLTASTTAWDNKISSQWLTSGSDLSYAAGFVAIGTTTQDTYPLNSSLSVFHANSANVSIRGTDDGTGLYSTISLSSKNRLSGDVSWTMANMDMNDGFATTSELAFLYFDGGPNPTAFPMWMSSTSVGVNTFIPTAALEVTGYAGQNILKLVDSSANEALNVSAAGDLTLFKGLRDSTGSIGSNGMILKSTGTSTKWIATSSLGITSSQWLTAGSDLSYAAGFVAIGTTTQDTYPLASSLSVYHANSANVNIRGTDDGTGLYSTMSLSSKNRVLGDVSWTMANIDMSDGLATTSELAFLYFDGGGGPSGYPMWMSSTSVGINSFLPSANLEVVGTGGRNILKLVDSSANEVLNVNAGGDLTLLKGLRDSTGNLGTDGQLLQTTGTSTKWATVSGSSQWTTTSTGIFYNSGLVGIGTSSPAASLAVVGNSVITGTLSAGTTTVPAINVNGKISLNGSTMMYLPDQASFADTMYIGNVNGGGFQLAHTGGAEGQFNTFVGGYAGNDNTTGYFNTALGFQSLKNATTAAANTAVGVNALYSDTTGTSNSALGFQALSGNTAGTANTAIGVQALLSSNGNFNTALGESAFAASTGGSGNVALGRAAGYGTLADERSINDGNMTFVGYNASRDASVASTTIISNSTAIGYNAKVGGSNMIVLGAVGVNVGIGTTTPSAMLTVGSNNNFTVSSAGVITNGTWNGTIIGTLYGGTGTSTLSTAAIPENSNYLYYTDSRARNAISTTATGLSYATSTGVLSLNGSYEIPLTASTSNWNSAYNAVTASSSNWTTAYNQTLQWNGGSTNLVAVTGRTSLGLGDSATLASSTWLKVANNLSDLGSISTARTNLGLGSMALEANTGSTTIITVGTITSGTWNGSIIDIAHGGTGSSTLNTAVVAENSNFLYYTDTRARNSISATAGSGLTYSTSTGIFSIAMASSTANGYLSSTDWSTFNNKVSSQWTTAGSDISYAAGGVSIGTTTANGPLYIYDGSYLHANPTAIVIQGGSDVNGTYSGIALGAASSTNATTTGAQWLMLSDDHGTEEPSLDFGYFNSHTGQFVSPMFMDNLGAAGNVGFGGGVYDNTHYLGAAGQVLQSTGSGVAWANAAGGSASQWVSTSTGIYFSSSTNNVGIGTTNPTTGGGYNTLTIQGYFGGQMDFKYDTGTANATTTGRISIMNDSLNIAAASTINLAIGSTVTTSQPVLTVASTGYIGIGTTSPDSKLTISNNTASIATPPVGTILHLAGADGALNRVFMDSYNQTNHLDFRKANGTAAAPTPLIANDIIGIVGAFGYGSSTYSAARAGINFSADENWTDAANGTYMTFNTTPNLGTSYTERMRITNAGKVGIGTTTPTALFMVQGAASYAGQLLDVASSSGAAYLHVMSSGNVGVGTSTPLDLLTLNAVSGKGLSVYDATFSSNGLAQLYNYNDGGRLWLQSTSTSLNVNLSALTKSWINPSNPASGVLVIGSSAAYSNSVLTIKGTSSNAIMSIISSSSSPLVTVTDVGSVGIGTTTPNGALDVNGGTRIMGASTFTTGAGLELGYTAGNTQLTSYDRTGGVYKPMLFNALNYHFLNSNAYFDGNVGIGTTSPSYPLHVEKDQNSGTILGVQNAATGTAAYSIIEATEDGINKSVGMFHTNTGYTTAGVFTANTGYVDSFDAGGLALGSRNAAGILRFYTGGSAASNERMRIDSSGNVGIGTTSPGSALEVNGSITVGNLQYYSARDTTGASRGLMWLSNDATNVLNFRNNQAGTGGPISFQTGTTERMRVDTGGNVGIGTTTPNAKLTVDGGGSDAIGINIGSNNHGLIKLYNSGSVSYFKSRNYADSGYNSAIYDATQHIFDVAGVEKVRIDTAGSVGIGTTTPGAKLAVVGDGTAGTAQTILDMGGVYHGEFRFLTDDTANPNMRMYRNDGAGSYSPYQMRMLGNVLAFETGAVTATKGSETYSVKSLSMSPTGMIGIGTNYASTPLDIVVGYPKTDTSTSRYVTSWRSNEGSNYNQLITNMIGGATQADRTWAFQTTESGISNTGNISFQPYGGNVGIGTTIPGATLQVGPMSTGAIPAGTSLSVLDNIRLFGGGNTGYGAYIRNTASGYRDMILGTRNLGSDLDTMTLQGQTGNVGIGTTSPLAKLTIVSPSNTYGSTYTPSLSIRQPANNAFGFDWIQDDQVNGNLFLHRVEAGVSNVEMSFRRNATGVGVGTKAASNPFSVQYPYYSVGTASQAASSTVIGVGTSFAGNMVGMVLVYNDGTWGGYITAVTDATHLTVSTTQTVPAQAYTIEYAGLQVNGTGQVGILATNPNTALQVGHGNGQFTAKVLAGGTNGAPVFSLYRSGIRESVLAQTGTNLVIANTGGLANYNDATINTAVSTGLSIDSTGNVGIGVTGALSKLDVNGGISVGSYAGLNAAPSNGMIVAGPVGIGEAAQSGSKLAVLGGVVIGSDTSYTRSAVTSGNLIIQGNIGVGVITPTAGLDVDSSLRTKGIFKPAYNPYYAFASSTWAINNDSGMAAGLIYTGAATTSGAFPFDQYGELVIQGNPRSGAYNSGISLVTGQGTAQTVGMRVDGAGNVGIGTTSPAATLQVYKATSVGTDVLLGVSTSTSGTGQFVFKVTANGNVYGDGATYNVGADYAEYFYTHDTDLTPGEAVCVDINTPNAVSRCTRGEDPNVMGIVSTNPSVVGNNIPAAANSNNYKIIGMLGQVPAKVSAENGAVNIGDSLTSASSTPGYLMKANPGDSTVGVALEGLTNGSGSIQVLISRRNKTVAAEQIEQNVMNNISTSYLQNQVSTILNSLVTDPSTSAPIKNLIQDQINQFSATLTIKFNSIDSSIVGLNSSVSGLNARISGLEGQFAALGGRTLSDYFNFSTSTAVLGIKIGNNAASTTPDVAVVEIAANASTTAFVVNQAGTGDVASFNNQDVTVMNIANDGVVKVVGDLLVDGRVMTCAGGVCPTALDSAVDSTMADMGVEGNVVAGGFQSYCATGYTWVPGSAKYGTMPGFCVMTEKATKDAAGLPSATIPGLAWDNVSQGEAQLACQSLGNNYHLLSDQEWMTLADNILKTAANDINTSTTGMQLAIDNTTFKLSNNNTVYGLSSASTGEWVDKISYGSLLPASTDWAEFNAVASFKGFENSLPPYYMLDSTYYPANGMGMIKTGADDQSLRGFVRGFNGLYSLDLSNAPTMASAEIGFRCAR